MVRHQKLRFLVGLAFVGLDLISQQVVAMAAPNPIFNPILPEIREQLPQGAKLRLPETLPPIPFELYPYVKSNADSLTVFLAFSPDCATTSNPADCTLGGLGIIGPAGSDTWRNGANSIVSTQLTTGITAYHVTRGAGQNMNRLIYWEQDGFLYGVGGLGALVTGEDLLIVANSMATQPVLTP
ncbi:MAG TPA: hypothetical protein V6D29_10745 [Leptolyngbyaceae cyanobacterium]